MNTSVGICDFTISRDRRVISLMYPGYIANSVKRSKNACLNT